MQIPSYQRTELPEGQGSSALALSQEWSRPMSIPKRDAGYGFSKISGAMNDLSDRFKQAEDVEDYSGAIVKAHRGLADIQDRISQDAEIRAMDREQHEKWFEEQSRDLRDTIVGGMKSSRAKEKFTTAYEELNTTNLVRVRDVARQRFVDRSRASTEAGLDELSNLMIRTGDLSKYAAMEGIVQGKVSAGVFTAQEGEQLIDKWRSKSLAGYWERKIEEAPTTVYAILKEQNPESFKQLDEDTKTKLLLKAKQASETQGHQVRLQMAYLELDKEFGGNPGRKIAYLENPKNMPELRLDERNQLITTYHAQISRARESFNQARIDGNRNEADLFARAYTAQDYEKAARILAGARNLSAEQRMHFGSALKAGKTVDVTDPNVRTDFVTAFHQRRVPGEADAPYSDDAYIMAVDARRLNGLSNNDADRLIAAVKDKRSRYSEGIRYAEDLYNKTFPNKSDPAMALRRPDFVDFLQTEWTRIEGEKGRALTLGEQSDVIHQWLDKQVTQKDAYLWFIDRTSIPWSDKIKGKGSFTQEGPVQPGRGLGTSYAGGAQSMTGPAGPAEINGVPREAADQIRKIFEAENKRNPKSPPLLATPQNIRAFYDNPKNKHLFGGGR